MQLNTVEEKKFAKKLAETGMDDILYHKEITHATGIELAWRYLQLRGKQPPFRLNSYMKKASGFSISGTDLRERWYNLAVLGEWKGTKRGNWKDKEEYNGSK